jgi:septal ring factor EnvC (AmiA/AmiB activator)
MPPGFRKPKILKSISEQIAEIDEQIANLKVKKKELIAEQEKQAIAQLLEAAKSAGKTPAELVAELSSKPSEE